MVQRSATSREAIQEVWPNGAGASAHRRLPSTETKYFRIAPGTEPNSIRSPSTEAKYFRIATGKELDSPAILSALNESIAHSAQH